jgi:hypothetical protein
MCEHCNEIQKNITKIESNPSTEFYKIKDNSKVYCLLEDEDSIPYSHIDGSIYFESLCRYDCDEGIKIHKDELSHIEKSKDYEYIFFKVNSGVIHTLITEYSNVEEIKNYFLIN